MKIEGSCHCGKISYEAEINPEYVIIATVQTVRPSPARHIEPMFR
jgi:hypothetical protein